MLAVLLLHEELLPRELLVGEFIVPAGKFLGELLQRVKHNLVLQDLVSDHAPDLLHLLLVGYLQELDLPQLLGLSPLFLLLLLALLGLHWGLTRSSLTGIWEHCGSSNVDGSSEEVLNGLALGLWCDPHARW